MTVREAKELWEDLIPESEVLYKLGIATRTLRDWRANGQLKQGIDFQSVNGRRFTYKATSLIKLLNFQPNDPISSRP